MLVRDVQRVEGRSSYLALSTVGRLVNRQALSIPRGNSDTGVMPRVTQRHMRTRLSIASLLAMGAYTVGQAEVPCLSVYR